MSNYPYSNAEMETTIEEKLEEILNRFDRPYLNISLVPSAISLNLSILYSLQIGNVGKKKFGYVGSNLSDLIDKAFLEAKEK